MTGTDTVPAFCATVNVAADTVRTLEPDDELEELAPLELDVDPPPDDELELEDDEGSCVATLADELFEAVPEP